jgi:hypothetical protein
MIFIKKNITLISLPLILALFGLIEFSLFKNVWLAIFIPTGTYLISGIIIFIINF